MPQGEQRPLQTARRSRRDDASAISMRCRRTCASSPAATARSAASTTTRSARPMRTATVIGGKYLAVASAEYEYYFNEDWGAAVFVDAGDAFTDEFNLNAARGRGRALAFAAGTDPRRRRLSRCTRTAPAEQLAPARAAGAGPVNRRRVKKVAAWTGGSLRRVAAVARAAWSRGCCSRPRARAGWRARSRQRFAPQVKYARSTAPSPASSTSRDFRFEGGPDTAQDPHREDDAWIPR